jgi:hypothetical protein
MATFRDKTEFALLPIVLNFFIENCGQSLKSQDLLAYFQLFTIIPGNHRPKFTERLLNGLILIMEYKIDTPMAFFALDGKTSEIVLLTIPADVLQDGFCLELLMQLFSYPADVGFLIQLCNENESLSLSFVNGNLSLNECKISCRFQLGRWVTITISCNRKSMSLLLDDKEVLVENERLFFRENLTTNSVGSSLHCNIAKIELYRKPKDVISEKNLYFRFDALTVYENFAIYQDIAANVSAKIFQMYPPPTAVLDHIGGVSALVPLFAQLEQPAIDGSCDSSGLLDNTLLLLRAVLGNSEEHQQSFGSIDGFRLISVLLSIASARHPFNLQCIEPFVQLYQSLTHFPLIVQMIEHIILNVQLWLSQPAEFQEELFTRLFGLVVRTMGEHPDDSSLPSVVSLTKILYSIQTFLVEPKHALLASLFWEFAKSVAMHYVTAVDVSILICFSRTREVARESLGCFKELLLSNNQMFIDALQRLDFNFAEFFPLLSSIDPDIVFTALEVFVHLVPRLVKRSYSRTEWVTTMLLLFDPRSVTVEFVERLANLVYQGRDLNQPTLIPFLLLSLLYIDCTDARRFFDGFLEAFRPHVANRLEVNQHIFIMFLVHLHVNCEDTAFVTSCNRKVGLLLLEKANIDPVMSFVTLVELLSVKLKLKMDDFLRDFFLEFAQTRLPAEKRALIVPAIYRFLFKIPDFDPVWQDPFTEIQNRHGKVDFRTLLAVLYHEGQIQVQYHYGTRTNVKGEWVDAPLAYSLLITMNDYPIYSLDVMSHLFAVGISHPPQCQQFINALELFFRSRSNPDWRRYFIRIFGSLMRSVFAGNHSGNLVALLLEYIQTYEEILASEFRIKIIIPENCDTFIAFVRSPFGSDLESTNRMLFCAAVCERSVKLEGELSRQFQEQKRIELAKLADVSQIATISATIAQNDLAVEQFGTEKRESRLRAAKKYRALVQSLSNDNGPWSTPELVQQRHVKLQNAVLKRFVRLKMKPHLEFQDHRAASLTRDLGSSDDAQEKYQKELSGLKLQEFKGDFALLVLSEETIKDNQALTITDLRLKCDAQLISPAMVVNNYCR